MNIVFLVDFYYPKFSAVSKCAYNIAAEMAKKNNVTVISIDGISRDYRIEMVDNHKLIRGYVKDLAIRKKVQKSIKEGKFIKKTINSFVYNYYRAKSYVKALISNQNTDIQKIKAFDKILETQEIDVLIPVCIPFEAVLSSVKFKKKHTKVKLIPILFDRFTYNESLHRNKINMLIKEKKHKSLEQEMVLYSDRIYSMKQLKRTFKNMFPVEIDRFRFVEHPLLKKIHLPICTDKSNSISIIYVGALYKEFRSPKFVLDVFSKMGQEFEVSFYSSGDCEDIIKHYSQRPNSIFKQYGYVEIETLKNAYSCADIFLSIGNQTMENVTSKIFEYISIGKPIIHFYYNDDDPTLELLRNYPLAICFKQNYSNMSNLANDVSVFCVQNYKKNIKFEEISTLYKDANPAYIVDMIESDINY